MTFTEDNEIVCETRLNVIHTYIHTYLYTKIGFKVGLLLTEAKKPKSHYNFSFIFIFLTGWEAFHCMAVIPDVEISLCWARSLMLFPTVIYLLPTLPKRIP